MYIVIDVCIHVLSPKYWDLINQLPFLDDQSNKPSDDLPPVFSITGSSSMYRTPQNHHDFDFVNVDIEEQLPPPYDDVFVIKPPRPIQ